MNENELREQIINGLAACIPETEEDAKLGCSNCPYGCCKADAVRLPIQMIEDIRALLKAQEPRLLSVEKVVGYVVLKRDATLWFEFRNGIKEMNAKDIVYNDFLCDEDFPTLADPNLEWEDGGKHDGVIIAEYNDTFRCWTSCPSEEQRKAEEWK